MNKPILNFRFEQFEPLTQAEMATLLGITKSAQEKLERKLFERLRSEFAARGIGIEDSQTLLTILRGL